jgi:small subunit ribosomal protein S21
MKTEQEAQDGHRRSQRSAVRRPFAYRQRGQAAGASRTNPITWSENAAADASLRGQTDRCRLRRFKKLLEWSGLTKELRKRKYYEKPCEARRRTKLRKLSGIRKGKLQGQGKSQR